jgi:two-component system sensor histidine kinase/response regulator
MNTKAPSISELSYRQPLTLMSFQTGRGMKPRSADVDTGRIFESVWLNSSEAMRITDATGNIVAVNDAYCRMVDMQRHELVGEPFTIVFDQSVEPSALLAEYCRRFSEQNVEPLMDRRLSLRGGRQVYVETSNAYIKGVDGATFVLSIIRDITDRKVAEESLKESELKYRELFDNAVQGMFQSSVDGRLLSANAALLKMLGYDSVEQLGARNLSDLYVHPAQRKALSIMLSESGVCSNVELALIRKDGTVITVVEHSRALKDAAGNVTAFEGMLENITKRKLVEDANKQAEATVQHERNILRTLVDNLPDLIYFKDAEGKYILNNQAHLRSIGAERQEDVLGKSSYDFHPTELARQYQEDEMGIVRSGKPLLEREELAFHKDTEENRWHLTSKIPLVDSQDIVTGLVGISRDITERKELESRMRENLSALQASREQLAQLNKQKDRMMSVLSHDLRSPFNSILGFCEILLTEGQAISEEERIEYTTYVRNSAEQQLVLLDKLLDWSRLETGRVKFDIRDIDLGEIAAHSVASHLGTAKQKEIILQSTLPRDLHARGDAEMMTQVFNNLISNALKFTPVHGLISIDLVKAEGKEWVVTVKDSGVGIAEENLGKLFKIEENFTRPGLGGEKGTGLGLSLVAEILHKHSGSIVVESGVGIGTTFTIRLPKPSLEKEMTVLVVDDDQGVRVLHARHLKRMFPDSQVLQASNGKEAFELAKKFRPRFIVTDYSMPGMNGYELLNLVKQDTSMKDIPVIVVSGKDSEDGKESLLLCGASAVLTKPVSSKDLQETIEGVLAAKV